LNGPNGLGRGKKRKPRKAWDQRQHRNLDDDSVERRNTVKVLLFFDICEDCAASRHPRAR